VAHDASFPPPDGPGLGGTEGGPGDWVEPPGRVTMRRGRYATIISARLAGRDATGPGRRSTGRGIPPVRPGATSPGRSDRAARRIPGRLATASAFAAPGRDWRPDHGRSFVSRRPNPPATTAAPDRAIASPPPPRDLSHRRRGPN